MHKQSAFVATGALLLATAAHAQSSGTVYNTSLHDQPGTTTTVSATGTRTTSSDTETGPSYILNTWQQADVAKGATVGITTDYAHNGNGSIYFATSPDDSSKADLTQFISGYTTPVALQSLLGLSYDYYRSSSSNVAARYAPVIRFDMKLTDKANNQAYGGSLVFENAYQTTNPQAIPTDRWMTNTASLTSGNFYSTSGKLASSGPGAGDNVKTLQGWIDTAASKGYSLGVYGVEVGVGSGWDNTFVGAVDNVNFSFAGGPSVSDNFEVAGDTVSAAPEPGVWALMLGGVGFMGAALRRRRGLATA